VEGGGGHGAGGTAARPPHVIAPDEVAAWLANSVNKVVTYHRTTREAAYDILEHGIDIGRSRIGSYGQGFYTATETDPLFGSVELAVAVRLTRPLVGDVEEVAEQVDAVAPRTRAGQVRITPAVAIAIRRELLGLGYDGIIVRDAGGDGIDYVVALLEESIRIVRP
jgi:hypothetical protein